MVAGSPENLVTITFNKEVELYKKIIRPDGQTLAEAQAAAKVKFGDPLSPGAPKLARMME